MMTNWYEKSINMLQLNGKGECTQEAYTRAVRILTELYGRPRIESPKHRLFLWPAPSGSAAPGGLRYRQSA